MSPRQTRQTPPLGARNHVGLVLAALLAVADVVSLLFASNLVDPTQPGPPLDVLWFCFVMGVVTLAGVGLAWAGRWRRPAVRVAAVARVLSAITSLPAFFVGGVPAGLVIFAVVGVVLTLVAVWLMLSRPRRAATAATVAA